MTKHQYRELESFCKELAAVNVETIGVEVIRDEKQVPIQTGDNLELKFNTVVAIRLTSCKKYADVPDVDYYLLDDIVTNKTMIDKKEHGKIEEEIEARHKVVVDTLKALVPNARLFKGQVLP